MGFVYNNTWEAFCKTYFELHGYFVTTNLFAALIEPGEIEAMREDGIIADGMAPEKKPDARTTKIEADLVAYRIPGTNLGMYPLDKMRKDADPSEFFAGEEKCLVGGNASDLQLVYVEVRANLSINNPQSQIASFFNEGEGSTERRKIGRMVEVLTRRFGVKPQVVVMAFELGDYKKKFGASGWMYKEFFTIFDFLQARIKESFEVKKRVQYNDPILEMLRYLERAGQQKFNRENTET